MLRVAYSHPVISRVVPRSFPDTRSFSEGCSEVGHDYLKARIKAHEEGYVKSTKHRRSLKLIHYEAFLAEEDAMRREEYFKGVMGTKR